MKITKKFIIISFTLTALLVAGGFLAAQYGFFGGGTNAPSVPEDTMTRGLVGYWSMDEGTGSTAYDGSGDGNDGTIYGAQWTKGKNGGALQFDGVDDYVDCGNDASLNITDAITIEAWVKPGLTQCSYSTIFSKTDSSVYSWHIDYNEDSDTGWRFFEGGASYNIQYVPTNVWSHMVVTRNGTVGQWYRNGVPDKSFTFSSDFPISTAKVLIGARGLTGSQYRYFNGTIDEVRIYNRALSAEEVRYHYNHGGPVAHWKFDEGSGTTIHDSSGNGHNGTMHE